MINLGIYIVYEMKRYITGEKIFHHTDRIEDWKNGKIVKPVTVEIHPTNICNNDCYYCVSKGIHDGKSLNISEMRVIIDKLIAMGVKGLIFSGGGEPLCNKDTIPAVVYAKKSGLSVGLITNGVELDEHNSRILGDNCEWVRVSLDSLDSGTYEKIRGMDGFEKAKKGLMMLLDVKGQCSVGTQMVVNRYNYTEIEKFVVGLRDFEKLDYVQIRPLEMYSGDTPYSESELNEIKSEFEKIKNFKKVIISDKWDMIYDDNYGFSECHCYGMIGAVDAYGDIFPCCHAIKVLRYGNLLTDEVDTIFLNREEMASATLKNRLHKICPIGCRGSNINRRLEDIKKGVDHADFL